MFDKLLCSFRFASFLFTLWTFLIFPFGQLSGNNVIKRVRKYLEKNRRRYCSSGTERTLSCKSMTRFFISEVLKTGMCLFICKYMSVKALIFLPLFWLFYGDKAVSRCDQFLFLLTLSCCKLYHQQPTITYFNNLPFLRKWKWANLLASCLQIVYCDN